MRYVAYIVIVPVTSFFLSVIWYRLWFFHGWFGTPQVLHKIFDVDGERSYDFTALEMFIIVLVLLYAVLFVVHTFIFKRERS